MKIKFLFSTAVSNLSLILTFYFLGGRGYIIQPKSQSEPYFNFLFSWGWGVRTPSTPNRNLSLILAFCFLGNGGGVHNSTQISI